MNLHALLVLFFSDLSLTHTCTSSMSLNIIHCQHLAVAVRVYYMYTFQLKQLIRSSKAGGCYIQRTTTTVIQLISSAY